MKVNLMFSINLIIKTNINKKIKKIENVLIILVLKVIELNEIQNASLWIVVKKVFISIIIQFKLLLYPK